MMSLDPTEEPRHVCSRTATMVSSSTPSKEKVILDEELSEPHEQQGPSRLRRIAILCVFCSAQFFDILNPDAVIMTLPAIRKLGKDLDFTPGALSWILSAYTLTFASFMLIAGTVSDIFHPKPVFCLGFALLGLFSIPVAASIHPIMSIVFRALQGLGAAMNVTSAVSMIRTTFQDPMERSNAYAAYALAGAFGNIAGFLVGGVLTACASWRWVHYLVAIIVIPFSAIAWFILPPHKTPPKDQRRRIDFTGVATLTVGLILFVYAVSSGNDVGWGSPEIISTLVLSVVVCIVFFFVEMYVKNPALPPRTWSNKNFGPLFFYAWTPYWWGLSGEMQLVNVSMLLWHDPVLITAVRCLPLGVAAAVASYLAGKFVPRFKPKHVLLIAQVPMAVAAILFALADTSNKYWSHVFPGMIIGSLGVVPGFVACTTMFMDGARKGEEGVVGGVMYTAYQVGSTLGFAAVTSVTQGVNAGRPTDPISQFDGYAASFWSMAVLSCVVILVTAVFVRH